MSPIAPSVINRLKLLGVLVGALMVVWGGYEIYDSLRFHIISTTPSTSKVATITPFIKVNFNHSLSSTGLDVSSSPAIVNHSSVSGKVLTLGLSSPMDANKKYTITIGSISDTRGKTLKDKVIVFSPRYVAYSNLSDEQQKTLLQQQSTAAANQPPAFTGTDALTADGVSVEQVQAFEQGITSFASTTHLSPHSVDISSDVSPGPIDQSTGNFAVTFTVAIDGTNYGAKLECIGVTGAELWLYDTQSGGQRFDSGSITIQ